MNASGHCHCTVAVNSFERAGWCRITDKPLDMGSIATIRIGWGGYLGTENEQVRFSFSAPGIASFQ